jgi:3-hydroxybutyryl-CoA dehydrogenase
MNVLVIGAGTMGHSIAQVFASYGYPTSLVDQQQAQLEVARQLIAGNLQVMKEEEFITDEQIANVDKYLQYSLDMEASAKQADLVVEAIPENPAFKFDLFKQLDEWCAPSTILTSTTSVLNIYEFITVSHPERLVIGHWCNPPHIIPLVEIVLGPETGEKTVETFKEVLIGMGKVPVVLKKCVPGFIVNRLNCALAREAGHMVSEGWVSPEDVDAALTSNFGLKAPFEGPLELQDYIGWDIGVAAGNYLYQFLCNSITGMPFAEEMVKQGKLGIKSGQGLKDYSGKSRDEWQNIRNLKIIKVVKTRNSFNA